MIYFHVSIAHLNFFLVFFKFVKIYLNLIHNYSIIELQIKKVLKIMSLAKNIRYLRKKFNYSQDFIAEKLGYKSYTTVQKWEMGISEPSISKLKELSDLFNVDINDMTTKNMEKEEHIIQSTRHKLKGVHIPVLGTVPAGIPVEAVEDVLDWEEITEDMAATGEFFALKIKGHSMEPKIGDGDIVIVRIQSDVDSGSIVIARIGNDEEVTCKKLLKNKDGVTFVPFNPSYEALYYTNEQIHTLPVTIMGKVIELRSKFE